MTDKTTIRNIDPDTLWDAKIYAAQTKLTMEKPSPSHWNG